jgi:hypothetical protein
VAFRYFDRNNAGFIRTDDLENILHGLGNALSRGYVQDLIAAACDSRESSSRVFYAPVIKAVTAASSASHAPPINDATPAISTFSTSSTISTTPPPILKEEEEADNVDQQQ